MAKIQHNYDGPSALITALTCGNIDTPEQGYLPPYSAQGERMGRRKEKLKNQVFLHEF